MIDVITDTALLCLGVIAVLAVIEIMSTAIEAAVEWWRDHQERRP